MELVDMTADFFEGQLVDAVGAVFSNAEVI